jgi:hypothetical protein
MGYFEYGTESSGPLMVKNSFNLLCCEISSSCTVMKVECSHTSVCVLYLKYRAHRFRQSGLMFQSQIYGIYFYKSFRMSQSTAALPLAQKPATSTSVSRMFGHSG